MPLLRTAAAWLAVPFVILWLFWLDSHERNNPWGD